MKIRLYQINAKRDTEHVIFMNYATYATDGSKCVLRPEIYDLVFDGEVDCGTLEDVFELFNVKYPQGYTGRSMSVSDVVEVKKDDGRSSFFYCDTIGFVPVKFDANQAKPMTWQQKMVEMTYEELCRRFRDAEREGKHLTGYIVFTKDSFTTLYSEAARTYVVSSNNKAYRPGMGGYSIFGSSLDGSDRMVRLEGYMAAEKGGKDGWKIERCYLYEEASEEPEEIEINRRLRDAINAFCKYRVQHNLCTEQDCCSFCHVNDVYTMVTDMVMSCAEDEEDDAE